MALTSAEKENIQIVFDGMDAILKTKNEKRIEETFATDFIQHNPWAKDGIDHVKEMLQFPFGYKPIRWVSEGDIMVYLGYYTAPNPLGEHPLYCADMWRIEDGKIKEHWDALVPMPQGQVDKALAGSGNGAAEISDEKQALNKQAVIHFCDWVLNRGEISKIKELVSEKYIYHHETEGELKSHTVLEDHIVNKNGGKMTHDLKKVLASGDLVMTHGHFFGAEERVTFEFYRMDDDSKIVEHWSISQPIVPLAEAANVHPHF